MRSIVPWLQGRATLSTTSVSALSAKGCLNVFSLHCNVESLRLLGSPRQHGGTTTTWLQVTQTCVCVGGGGGTVKSMSEVKWYLFERWGGFKRGYKGQGGLCDLCMGGCQCKMGGGINKLGQKHKWGKGKKSFFSLCLKSQSPQDQPG